MKLRFGSILRLVAFVAFFGFSGSGVAHIGFTISPLIVSFTSSPDTIQAGDSADLNWATRGADRVNLAWRTDNAPEECLHHVTVLPAKGLLTVHPRATTVYTLSCEADITQQVCAPVTVLVSVN